MERLNIVVWKWGKKYPSYYVDRLRHGLKRHLHQEFTFGVFHPEARDDYLTKIPGCFARLRVFDPAWQEKNNLTGRIVQMDLDVVITGPLDGLFNRPEKFVILTGCNASNPCPYNGSLMMLRAGARPDVLADFTLKNASSVPYFEFPDDQGWLAYKIPNAAGWQAGKDGVYCFQKPGWPKGEALPKDAKLVAFPGWRDPEKFKHLDWVKEHWQ